MPLLVVHACSMKSKNTSQWNHFADRFNPFAVKLTKRKPLHNYSNQSNLNWGQKLSSLQTISTRNNVISSPLPRYIMFEKGYHRKSVRKIRAQLFSAVQKKFLPQKFTVRNFLPVYAAWEISSMLPMFLDVFNGISRSILTRWLDCCLQKRRGWFRRQSE